jgi:hypothetical protein
MDDPRVFAAPDAVAQDLARIHALAGASLAASSVTAAQVWDAEVAAAMDRMLGPGHGEQLAALFAFAPSADVYRHLWRILARCERASDSLVRVFAIPVVIVAAASEAGAPPVTVAGALPDPGALVAILREHGALEGNETVALGNTLAGAHALDFARLPEILAWRDLGPAALPPAAIAVTGTDERVHLRFLLGTAMAAPGVDLFRGEVGKWGLPLSRVLSAALGAAGISLLALPRAPSPLVEAAWQGHRAQREVAAQLFASNAIRRLRAATGEPTAMISVHRSDGDARGGEVRLSLSSPYDPRTAEGFRYALAPLDRVDDVAGMFARLMEDCRVADVRRVPGLHADRDPATGLPLLFKAHADVVH